MAHSVSGYVRYVSMWFNTKFVRVPTILVEHQNYVEMWVEASIILPSLGR